MYNDNSVINLSFNLDKINKIKDDIINNYFFISDFLEDKKSKVIDRDSMDKVVAIQSKLDVAMNFSISKIDFILLELSKKIKLDNENINKISTNNEFTSRGYIDEMGDDFIAKKKSVSDANFFSDLDFSDFDTEKERIENTLNKKKEKNSRHSEDKKNDINISPEEILFFGERLDDIETKMKSDIEQLKMDNKFISDINDNLMLQMQSVAAKPYSDNFAYENNSFYLSLEKKLEEIVSKIDDINANLLNINILSEKIDKFVEYTQSKNNIDSPHNNHLSDKIVSLQKENDLYKRKFISSIQELETLKKQSHDDNFYFKNSDDNLMNTSKKLENLEAIISNQISDFRDIEFERDELVKLFENKILDLKTKLIEKETKLNELEFNSSNIPLVNYDNSSLHSNEDYYSLLLKIENKLNNLDRDFINKSGLEHAKENETEKIINYIDQKNSEGFLKIQNDLKESYEKLDKTISSKDSYLYNNRNRDSINEKPIKLENLEKNNIIKEQYFVDNILEDNLIDDLEGNINQLRQFEKFLIDFDFEIDRFKQ